MKQTCSAFCFRLVNKEKQRSSVLTASRSSTIIGQISHVISSFAAAAGEGAAVSAKTLARRLIIDDPSMACSERLAAAVACCSLAELSRYHITEVVTPYRTSVLYVPYGAMVRQSLLGS